MVTHDPLVAVSLCNTLGHSILSLTIEELMEADDYGWVGVMIREDWVVNALALSDV